MDNSSNEEATTSSACKQKARGRKRKRQDSESSTDVDDILPENLLEVEKSLQASAIKNNLDDASVKKILKKVVTNDHVLALVKLREEEEAALGQDTKNTHTKLTRAKAKELMSEVSPITAPWNLALTPIKHIPVKTRPEVEALITKELLEDEDDDEYQPTHDDVPSDDDQTLESCSDVESQPRTPATPHAAASPHVLKDGPFKVPQGISTPVRRKLIIEEEATIALRTRSKLSLSATPIEHIESSFVPPDEAPTPVVDDLWSQFLEECLNPLEGSKNEEDDDADPEYNVAADPDANDEDEEALESSIIKISKKELNDLVGELFSIMPDDAIADNLVNNVLGEASGTQVQTHWDGKQEPLSDEDINKNCAERVAAEKRNSNIRVSIGKSEIENPLSDENVANNLQSTRNEMVTSTPVLRPRPGRPRTVQIDVKERCLSICPAGEGEGELPPPPLAALARGEGDSAATVLLHDDQQPKVLPEQVLLLQQQLRQHIQLAASNFLQLFVNPAHWKLAASYKEYLLQFNKMLDSNPESVVNVCNLKPALELVETWEETVSEDTPENKKLVEFIQSEAERGRRRYNQNCMYVGDFPDLIMDTIANSPVFLYPYLLPAMPYRADSNKKFSYRQCEDELLALGLSQFWKYVDDNPDLFKRKRPSGRQGVRSGLVIATNLVCKHMFPWLTPRMLISHIRRVKKEKDSPLYKLFETGEVTPVDHKLLPYNPKLTLYEQPEHEMPRIWARYLAKSSKRFRDLIYKRKHSGLPPSGVPLSKAAEVFKNPSPIHYIPRIRNKIYDDPDDRQDIEIKTNPATIEVINANNNNIENINETTRSNDKAESCSATPQNDTITDATTNNDDTTTDVTINNNGTTKDVTINNNDITTDVTMDNNDTVIDKTLTPGILVANIVTEMPKDAKVLGNLLPVTIQRSVPNTVTSSDVTTDTNANQTLPVRTIIVETSTGSYLVPFAVMQTTNTVNSINRPISSAKQTNKTDEQTNKTDEQTNKPVKKVRIDADEVNHCQCCILLRKNIKTQNKITEYFKYSGRNTCECRERKYPKISKRLKLLINNYKNSFWCEHNRVIRMMKQTEATIDDKIESSNESDDEQYDLEDIACVTTYQMKLTTRSMFLKNVYTKKKIYEALSEFDLNFDDPLDLCEQMYKILNKELIDLHNEFIAFLTAEQADKIFRFKDYFVLNCMKGLLKKVEEQVLDKDKKISILANLNQIFTDKVSTSCEICTGILVTLVGYPKLAQYVFSLFPHGENNAKKEDSCQPDTTTDQPEESSQQNTAIEQTNNRKNKEVNKTAKILEIIEQCNINTTVEREVDDHDDGLKSMPIVNDSNAMDDENEDAPCQENVDNEDEDQHTLQVKHESVGSNYQEVQITISKTELHDSFDRNITTPENMSEYEVVKSEVPDWKRDEDKLVLEVLLQYLTPQQRKDKTIMEILNEKNVYQMINESMPHKSIDDVRQRVMYLLEILVLSEY